MQGTSSCLKCPPPESHQPCTSYSDPRAPQTSTMTHIASCIRPDADKSSVYMTQETSSTLTVRRTSLSVQMNYQSPHPSCSLTDFQIAKEPTFPKVPLAKSPSLGTLTQPTASRYQLWPLARSPVGLSKPNPLSDKLAALSVGRSSTSLSDTAVLPETLPFWQRTGSLSRRRKVSVPELGNTMTTVQEMAIDSRKFLEQQSTSNSSAHVIQPRYLEDHHFASYQTMCLAMRDLAALQERTGEMAHLVMQ